MVSQLSECRDLYHKSVAAFDRGDSEAQNSLWSVRDDVTLANPLGPPAKGWAKVLQAIDSASAQISGGEGYTFDCITVVETSELAYEVGIERSTVKLGEASEKVPVSLR